MTSGSSRGLFALWALFWLLMAVVSLEDNLSDAGTRWWEPLLWEGSSCLVATFWLLMQRRSAPRWNEYLTQPLRWFGKHLAWLLVIAPTFVIAVYALRHLVYGLAGEVYEHESWGYLFVYESVKLLLFTSLWLSIIFGFASFARWQQERERLLTVQKHLAESQLAQLKAQLQPHFLFNTLNTISSLMQVNVERADKLLAQLADLLRVSMQAGERQFTPLREELRVLELYAHIMEERFAGRVTIAWNIAADTLDAEMPDLLLQPLLENAFKHGVERSSQAVAVTVAAARDGETLRISIHNAGGLLPKTVASGIGLRNCRERLQVLYGDRARLDLAQDTNGVSANLVMPFKPFTA